MDKYKKYYGLIVFLLLLSLTIYGIYKFVSPVFVEEEKALKKLKSAQTRLAQLENDEKTIRAKVAKLNESMSSAKKKIYSPVESNLESDTLFFTLYSDVIEMLHSNKVKINSIKYTYNPSDDAFAAYGHDVYFVCNLNMELVSNYERLGKLIESIYQYPYYIKIKGIDVKPYKKDKTVLITNMELNLYAHTIPDMTEEAPAQATKKPVNTTTKPVPVKTKAK